MCSLRLCCHILPTKLVTNYAVILCQLVTNYAVRLGQLVGRLHQLV